MIRGLARAGVALAVALPGAAAAAIVVPGFTEPARVVEVAAPYLAVVTAANVEVGDTVDAGEVLYELDAAALEAQLAIAGARRDARGDLAAAQARQALKQHQLDQVRAAHATGHAREDELAQARAETAIAGAEVQAARERQAQARLEYDRLAGEVERRRVRSPLPATVIERRREVGEVVTPADQVLAVLAVLDPLIARINLALADATGVAVDDTVEGSCAGQAVSARVARVAPVADAASATVAVELELDNADGRLTAGVSCQFELPGVSTP